MIETASEDFMTGNSVPAYISAKEFSSHIFASSTLVLSHLSLKIFLLHELAVAVPMPAKGISLFTSLCKSVVLISDQISA